MSRRRNMEYVYKAKYRRLMKYRDKVDPDFDGFYAAWREKQIPLDCHYHHVVPKFLGRNNDRTIRLTTWEHALAHLYLAKVFHYRGDSYGEKRMMQAYRELRKCQKQSDRMFTQVKKAIERRIEKYMRYT